MVKALLSWLLCSLLAPLDFRYLAVPVHPSDYVFSQRLHSCPLTNVYSTAELRSMTTGIRDIIRDLKTKMGPLQCAGMTLTSLTPIRDSEIISDDDNHDVHRAILNTLVHLFIMRIDWTQPFPTENVNLFRNNMLCQSTSKLEAINNLHTSLIHKWDALHCMTVSILADHAPDQILPEVAQSSVLDINILRYPSCHERTVRDCILANHASNVLDALEKVTYTLSCDNR